MNDEQQQPGGAEHSPDPSPGNAEAQEAMAESVMLSYAQYEELKTLAKERDDYLKRLQRAVADYQNLQKRIDRFREASRADAVRGVVEEILPVADSLALAVKAARDTEGCDSIVHGLEMVRKGFYEGLERIGIRPIDAAGQKFDPSYHEAVMQVPDSECEPGTIVEELKKGFVMGEVVIRPSQVVVAVAPPDVPGPEPAAESEATED